jgi:DNA-binding beta-propeller fold protein YncE
VKSFGGPGKEAGKLNTPHGVWIDTRKDPATLIVADRGNSRLQVFDFEGKHLRFIQEKFAQPCHLAINKEGNVVVPDLSGWVSLLDKDDKLVGRLGEGKNGLKGQNGFPPQQWVEGEFTAPHCACWDNEGNIIVQDWNFAGRWAKLKRIK